MNSTKLLAQPILEESLSSAAQSPSMARPNGKVKATRNESFDSSISSTVRIDSAVRKGRERLKMSRRSSTSVSQRNSTVNSEKSSTNDLTVIENEKEEEDELMEVKNVEDGRGKDKQNALDSRFYKVILILIYRLISGQCHIQFQHCKRIVEKVQPAVMILIEAALWQPPFKIWRHRWQLVWM